MNFLKAVSACTTAALRSALSSLPSASSLMPLREHG